MQMINFLAQLWGFSIIIIALAFLINPKNVKSFFQLVDDDKALFLVGMINIVLGVALVLAYNTWDSSWRTIISILGWFVIVRGSVILFLPHVIKNIVAWIKNRMDWLQMAFVAAVVIGCALVYLGFAG